MARPRRLTESEQAQTRASDDPAPDHLVDELLPVDLDWRTAVRRHPWLSLGAAAGVGFVLGRLRGARLLEDLADIATAGVTAGLGAYLAPDLGGDLLDK